MKKKICILIGIIVIVLSSGCGLNFTPSERVEDMFNRYIKNDKDIMDELDTYMAEQNLSSSQKDKYKNIIKSEYATIKYDIKDERIDGNEAVVEAQIEVKDLYKASKEAGDYLSEHSQEFFTDGEYDRSKYIDYKLEKMEKYGDTVKYTVYVDLIHRDGIWTIEQLDNETLEKIHGIYDYENDTVA